MAISNETRGRLKKRGEPIALALGRLGLTPDGLTLVGFGVTAAGAIVLANQLWLVGGIVVFAGGAFDMLDGTLARATGRVSRFGAFMDSVFDRWGEALVYVGIVIGSTRADFQVGAWLAAAAMASAFLVSYARARSEGLGFTTGTARAPTAPTPRAAPGVVRRRGRCAPGGAGGVAAALDAPGSAVLAGALAIITLGATITVIQRVLHVRAQASGEASERPS